MTQTEAGEDILVVELFNPTWNEASQTLTYDVIALADYRGDGLGHLVERRADAELVESFDHASLFIDDCPDIRHCSRVIENALGRILAEVGRLPGDPVGQGWEWGR